MADKPSGPPVAWSGGERVRELLRRCGSTGDPAERAALLSRVATELDQAADDLASEAPISDSAADRSAFVAALQGQAGMARFMADVERCRRVARDTRETARR